MVGDGVNDAAALAAATVGIGVHGGAEAVLAAADVYLGRPGLTPVVELLEGSRRTLGVIRRNLVFSLAYNIVAVAFAITGHMSPILAAILMPLSVDDGRAEFVPGTDVLNSEFGIRSFECRPRTRQRDGCPTTSMLRRDCGAAVPAAGWSGAKFRNPECHSPT